MTITTATIEINCKHNLICGSLTHIITIINTNSNNPMFFYMKVYSKNKPNQL